MMPWTNDCSNIFIHANFMHGFLRNILKKEKKKYVYVKFISDILLKKVAMYDVKQL